MLHIISINQIANKEFSTALELTKQQKMKTYIVLLRGINVSGKNKLPMSALREVLNEMGFQNVQTYIQSGNILLDTDEEKVMITQKIREAIALKFGYDVPVIIRTIDEWKKAIQNYPFSLENEKIVAFTFLDTPVEEQKIEVNVIKEDQYQINKDIIYLHCPSGFADTKLTNNLFEKKLKVIATSRNLRTTLKLLELTKT